MSDIGTMFLEQSRTYLSGQYLPKIRRCVGTIAEEDLWWRPNPASNTIGNLLLHLAGNVRQWIVSGIGGEPDVRERQEEFDAGGGRSRDDLLALLERAVADVDRVLAGLSTDRLPERRMIQGRETSVFEAVYHVVEHFGMHTGQIITLTKLRTGADLRFYEVEDGITRRNW